MGHCRITRLADKCHLLEPSLPYDKGHADLDVTLTAVKLLGGGRTRGACVNGQLGHYDLKQTWVISAFKPVVGSLTLDVGWETIHHSDSLWS